MGKENKQRLIYRCTHKAKGFCGDQDHCASSGLAQSTWSKQNPLSRIVTHYNHWQNKTKTTMHIVMSLKIERNVNVIICSHEQRTNHDYLHFYVKITICTHEEKTNNASYIGSHIRQRDYAETKTIVQAVV
jgi:hypothetical protein